MRENSTKHIEQNQTKKKKQKKPASKREYRKIGTIVSKSSWQLFIISNDISIAAMTMMLQTTLLSLWSSSSFNGWPFVCQTKMIKFCPICWILCIEIVNLIKQKFCKLNLLTFDFSECVNVQMAYLRGKNPIEIQNSSCFDQVFLCG